MSIRLKCAGWNSESCDDGPGVRSVLFLQGCSKNCPGCHNAETHKHGKGIWCTIQEVVDLVKDKCQNKKLTISGGEPLEQQEALLELLPLLKAEGYEICLYTGWKLQLVPKSVLQYLDYLKVGAFQQELRDVNLQYVGSMNQKLYHVGSDGTLEALRVIE